MADNSASELPAISFLTETVKKIIADGRVLPAERDELHRTLERVLPKELRETAKGQRQKRAAEEEVAALRSRPVAVFDFMVAGVRYEDRDRIVRKYARDGDPVYLVREPENAYSRNAVRVLLKNGAQIGFVPEEYAVEVAPLLDAQHKQSAWLKKILRGGRVPIPVVVAEIFAPDTINARARTVTLDEIPAAPVLPQTRGRGRASADHSTEGAGFGCGMLVLVGLLFVLLVWVIVSSR